MKFIAKIIFCTFLYGSLLNAKTCGGNFDEFVSELKIEALEKGHSRKIVDDFFADSSHNPLVIKADRSQGVFLLPFLEFSNRLIADYRINLAKKNLKKFKSTFDNIEDRFGVPKGILLAFWAFETDFGVVQGDYNTLNSLLTLAHDCRRPELFKPQIFAALKLYQEKNFNPSLTKGAWAGEIGMVQMLPRDILQYGYDGDRDGKIDIQNSVSDALMSAANMLVGFGWRPNQPWMEQVFLPESFNWGLSGLDQKYTLDQWKKFGVESHNLNNSAYKQKASIIFPQGRNGPAFLVFQNFRVLFEWNQSFVYVTTAAYFANLLEGRNPLGTFNPDLGLDKNQMKKMQRKLIKLGYDVGKVDGILGAKTRAAVQKMQKIMGIPADAWPTPRFLDLL